METQRVHKVRNKKKEHDSIYSISTKWVIDANIKAFFDRIFHYWILDNFPMPNSTGIILKDWLRNPTEYQGKLEVTPMGVHNVINPLITNFVLDGLENRVTSGYQTTMTNPERTEWMKRKGHRSLFG